MSRGLCRPSGACFFSRGSGSGGLTPRRYDLPPLRGFFISSNRAALSGGLRPTAMICRPSGAFAWEMGITYYSGLRGRVADAPPLCSAAPPGLFWLTD